MIDQWLNADDYGRAGTGKREAGTKAPQPDRHGSSVSKPASVEPKSTKFKVTVVAGKATIRDKRRG